jgi:hypothetical protein
MTDSKCRVGSCRRSVFVASFVEVNVLSVGRVLAIFRMAHECFAKAVSNLNHMMLTNQLNRQNLRIFELMQCSSRVRENVQHIQHDGFVFILNVFMTSIRRKAYLEHVLYVVRNARRERSGTSCSLFESYMDLQSVTWPSANNGSC